MRTPKRQKRSKIMLPEIKLLITNLATSTNTSREALAKEIISKIKKQFPKEIPPVEDTVIKLISKARNHEINPLERNWNLAEINNLQALNIIHFDAEAVEYILKVQKWAREDSLNCSESKSLNFLTMAYYYQPITIRQAKWIAILYKALKYDIPFIWLASYFYSHHEIMCNLAGVPFETFELDLSLDSVDIFMKLVSKLIWSDDYRQASRNLLDNVKGGK